MYTARTSRLYAAYKLGPEGAPSVGLDWLNTRPAPVLADGRIVDAALVAEMIAEWAVVGGGLVTFRRTALVWGYLKDETCMTGYRRPPGEAADVTAVYQHATARARTSGHPVFLPAPPGATAMLDAAVLLADAIAVLTSALDRYLVGSGEMAAWYLSSPCNPQFCGYHGDGQDLARFGRSAAPLDLDAMAALRWLPGTGALPVVPGSAAGMAAAHSPTARLRLASSAQADSGLRAA